MMMFLSMNLAPAMHHFGISVSEAIVFVMAVLFFIMCHYFWPYDPSQVVQADPANDEMK